MELRNRNRWRRRATATLAAMGLITALSTAPAAADRPIFQDHITLEEELHELRQLTKSCGFEVLHEERINVVQRIHGDGSQELRLSIHERIVSPSTGEVLDHHMAGAQSLQESRAVEDGRLIIDVRARHAGLPSMWRKSGEGVLLRDAGLAILDVHVVLDISQDPPVLVTEDFDVQSVHGPHPELEMSEEEFTGFVCEALR